MVLWSRVLYSAGKRVRVRKVDELYGVCVGKLSMANMVLGTARQTRGHYVGKQSTVTMNAI